MSVNHYIILFLYAQIQIFFRGLNVYFVAFENRVRRLFLWSLQKNLIRLRFWSLLNPHMTLLLQMNSHLNRITSASKKLNWLRENIPLTIDSYNITRFYNNSLFKQNYEHVMAYCNPTSLMESLKFVVVNFCGNKVVANTIWFTICHHVYNRF